jgi:hypothetical protein
VWAARYTPEQLELCRSANRDLLEEGFQPGTLYVLNDAALRSVRNRPELALLCSRQDGYNLCTRQHDELNLPVLEGSDPPTLPERTGEITGERLAAYLGMGWSYPEGAAVWSVGYRSEILFRRETCSAQALRLRLLPAVGPRRQTLRVSVNDGPVTTSAYSSSEWSDVVVPLPPCDREGSVLRVALQVEHPISTIEGGAGRDARPLGVLLAEMEPITLPKGAE